MWYPYKEQNTLKGDNLLKSFSFIMLLFLIAIGITGCGEETADPITATKTEDALFGSLSEMKKPEVAVDPAAPGAPSAPTDGTPFVKSVGYYSDWKLTKELDNKKPVPVGTTIYIHIVFSEAMKHRLTDNPEKKGALPVLKYWVNSEVARFRMMQHGADGEDFVSGDAKPKGSGTDDFVCKYKVKKEDKGSQFWIRVGEWSMDLEWNKLKASYIHQTKLKLGKVPETTQEQPEEPVAVADEVKKESEATTVAPADTTPPTVISITHYRDSDGTIIPEGESVEHNTTVKTVFVLSEPIDPESIFVTYTTGGKEAKRFAYSTGGVHWRGLFQISKDKKTILCKQDAQEDTFMVTLEAAKDLAGNTLAELVTTPKLTVTPRTVVTTLEPTQPTEPQTPVDTPPTTVPNEPTPGGPVDLGYTFTLEGLTYPGYNPSPGLQRILDIHPSAQLPHFLEAVQMTEVISWAYRKSWTVYPDLRTNQASVDKMVAARNTVLAQFGLSQATGVLLSRFYFKKPQGNLPGHSQYWLMTEYLRLKLENPEANRDQLLDLFIDSINNGWIVGTVNPNSNR